MQELYYVASTISMLRNQYCAYTLDRDSMLLAFKLIRKYQFDFECHANRTRFWVPNSHKMNPFIALRFKCVDSEQDHFIGA